MGARLRALPQAGPVTRGQLVVDGAGRRVQAGRPVGNLCHRKVARRARKAGGILPSRRAALYHSFGIVVGRLSGWLSPGGFKAST